MRPVLSQWSKSSNTPLLLIRSISPPQKLPELTTSTDVSGNCRWRADQGTSYIKHNTGAGHTVHRCFSPPSSTNGTARYAVNDATLQDDENNEQRQEREYDSRK